MALINCRECGKEISSEAKACPHCGAPPVVTTQTKADPYKPHDRFLNKSFEITYQSQISFITEAVKLSALANGGAAVALLAYLGATAKGSGAAGQPGAIAVSTVNLPIDFVWPIFCFAFGIVFCVSSFAAAYFAQMAILKYWAMSEGVTEPPPLSIPYRDGHVKAFILALVMVIFSIVAFAIGAVWAGAVFAMYSGFTIAIILLTTVAFAFAVGVSSFRFAGRSEEQTRARFPAGTLARIDALLTDKEKRSDFIRDAVERELKRRERAERD